MPAPIFMPEHLAWLEPVVLGAIIVFFVDLIGNMLSFSNRFLNALVTSLVFAAIFGTMFYFAHRDGLDIRAGAPAAPVPAAAPAPSP